MLYAPGHCPLKDDLAWDLAHWGQQLLWGYDSRSHWSLLRVDDLVGGILGCGVYLLTRSMFEH